MTQASCHCGAVQITVTSAPVWVKQCNCSVCRRVGALWAYYSVADVTIAGLEATAGYVRTDAPEAPILAFHHCRTCGCTTHWQALNPEHDRMGINARLMPPQVMAGVRVRLFDGAETWRYLDED